MEEGMCLSEWIGLDWDGLAWFRLDVREGLSMT